MRRLGITPEAYEAALLINASPIAPGPDSPSAYYQHPQNPALRAFWDGRRQEWLGSRRAESDDEAILRAQLGAYKPRGDVLIKCPYCHQTGGVTTRRTTAKRGVSGGKATGAVLTGGMSLLATGLSRHEDVTKFRCQRCRTRWTA
jgi:hypothetical protein